jgi:hypothetical protein
MMDVVPHTDNYFAIGHLWLQKTIVHP